MRGYLHAWGGWVDGFGVRTEWVKGLARGVKGWAYYLIHVYISYVKHLEKTYDVFEIAGILFGFSFFLCDLYTREILNFL
jgi:hypothetical protein